MAFNNFIDNLKNHSGDLVNKIKDGKVKGNIASVVGGTGTKATIKTLTLEKTKMYEFIGMEMYDLYTAGEMNINAIEPFCKKITAINEEIATLETQNTKTCECGGILPPNSKFCPSCGKNVTIPAAVEEQQEEQEPVVCVCGSVIEDGQLMCMECGRRVALSL